MPTDPRVEQWLKDCEVLLNAGEPGSAYIAAEWALNGSSGRSDAQIAKGRCLVALERPGEAVPCFDAVLTSDPRNVAALLEKGRALMAKEQVNPAKKCFETAVQLDPKDLGAWNGLSEAVMASGNHQKAFEVLKRAIEANPTNERAWYNMAFEMIEHGVPEAAVNWLKGGLERIPASALLTHELAFALYRMGKVPEAIPLFKRALELDPDDAPGSRGMLMLMGGVMEGTTRIYFNEQELRPQGAKPPVDDDPANSWRRFLDESAVEHLAPETTSWDFEPDDDYSDLDRQLHAPPLPPASAAEWAARANDYFLRRKIDRAIVCFERAGELEPSNGSHFLGLAWCHLAMDRFGPATKAAEKACTLDPAASAPEIAKARLLQHQGRHDDALALLDQVGAKWPEERYVARLRALSQHQQGDFPAALATLKSIPAAASGLDTLMAEAAIYNQLDRRADLVDALERASRSSLESNAPRWFLACILLSEGRKPEAVRWLEECLANDPKHREALLQRAEILIETGRAEEALRSFDVVLAEHGQDWRILPAKVRLLAFLGRRSEAEATLVKAGVRRAEWNRYLE